MESRFINAQMLVLAREARGMTQKELADRLGFSQAHLSNYEAGVKSPIGEEVLNISKILNLDPTFFYQNGYRLPVLSLHRKRTTRSLKKEKELDAYWNLRRQALSKLLNAVEIKENLIYKGKLDISPSEMAIALKGVWGINNAPIYNLIGLLESNGIIIETFNFGSTSFDGVTFKTKGMPNFVFLNNDFPIDRVRFTLAHELGHIVMHEFTGGEDLEKEANMFASEFLMPESGIRHELTGLSISRLHDLKNKWLVSMAALLERAKELKTIGIKRYNSIKIEMSKLGMRKYEPPILSYQETPTIVKKLFEMHKQHLNYSDNDLSVLTGLNVDEFVVSNRRIDYDADNRVPFDFLE